MIEPKAFYDAVRLAPFGGRLTEEQVHGMDGLLLAFAEVGDRRPKTLAYGCASVFHETGRRMVPVREGFARSDADARRIVARAGYAYAKALPPHGHVYYGRGQIQLTWQRNYARASAVAGVDLVRDPDKMLDPVISSRVTWAGLQGGWWNARGKGIAFYLPDAGDDDLQGARRTVNLTDRWEDIAGYYRAFKAAVDLAWEAPRADPIRPLPRPAPDPDAARLAELARWRAAYPEAEAAALIDWLQRRPA